MQVVFKGDVVFTSQNPQEIMEYMAHSIKIPCAPDYLDHIPVTAAIVDLMSMDKDYQVPYIDFFSFLEHHRALQAFLEEFKRQNVGGVCTTNLNAILPISEYIAGCFDWGKSGNGLQYWEFIDTLWVEECNATIQ